MTLFITSEYFIKLISDVTHCPRKTRKARKISAEDLSLTASYPHSSHSFRGFWDNFIPD